MARHWVGTPGRTLVEPGRPGLQVYFRVKQVARIIQHSETWVRSAMKRGLLKSSRPFGHHWYYIHREDLIGFLDQHGLDPGVYRVALQPRDARVFCMTTDALLRRGLTEANPAYVSTPLRLGIAIATTPCWGVLIDAETTGGERARELVAELSARPDRPLLMAACGDGGPAAVGHGWDLVLQRPFDVRKLVTLFRDLCRQAGSRTPPIVTPVGIHRRKRRKKT